MREIRSKGYDEMKQAQSWDPNLPPGVTEQDISRAADPYPPDAIRPSVKQDNTGTSAVSNVDFNTLKAEYREWGGVVPPEYDRIGGTEERFPVDLEFHFAYSFDPDKGVQILTHQDIWVTPVGQNTLLVKITGEMMDYLFENFDEQIKRDVDEHIEPEYPNYGPDTRAEQLG